MFFLNFVIFLTLRTRLRISNLRVYLCDEMSLSDYYIINGICADGEQAKAFLFSEGRTKVKRFIGSPRLNKWTFTTCY